MRDFFIQNAMNTAYHFNEMYNPLCKWRNVFFSRDLWIFCIQTNMKSVKETFEDYSFRLKRLISAQTRFVCGQNNEKCILFTKFQYSHTIKYYVKSKTLSLENNFISHRRCVWDFLKLNYLVGA